MTAALCIAFGVVGLSDRASAEEETAFDTKSLVSVSEGASVRISTDTETDKIDKAGLLIESEVKYEAELNGKFDGDLTLGFGFQNDEGFRDGMDLFMHITDATDPNNTFTVKYRSLNNWGSTGYSGAFVLYGDQVRSSLYWNADTWYNYEMGTEEPMCSPMFSGCQGNHFGYLKLVWEEDILKVQVSKHDSDTDIRTIAAFDGTEEFVAGTSWGLPKLDFSDGYYVSFETTDKAPDTYIFEVDAYGEKTDFSKATQDKIPTFYEKMQGEPRVTVDTTPLTGVVQEEITLPNATVTVGNGAPENVYKVTVDGPNGSAVKGQNVTKTLKFTPDVKGEYTITYQGVESFTPSGDTNPNIVTVRCTVYEFVDAASLVEKNDKVKTETGKTSISIAEDGSVSGLRATFGAGESSFRFNTIFTGDFSLSLQADLLEVGGGFSEVRVRFSDIDDAENYVDVVMAPGIASWANWYTHMLVEYKGEKFTTNHNNGGNGTVWNTEQIAENSKKPDTTSGWSEMAGMTNFLANFAPGARTDVSGTGYIGFDPDTLSFMTEYGGAKYTVASFTGDKYAWSNLFSGFENGYTVEVIVTGAAEGASLTFTELNGLSLSETFLPAELSEAKSVLLGEKSLTLEAKNAEYTDKGAVLYKSAEGYDFGIIDKTLTDYTVKYNDAETEKVDLTKVGEYTIVYEGGATRTVTVTPDVTKPEIGWSEGITGDTITVKNKGDIKVNASDVVATDSLDGTLTAVVTVKVPDSDEYVAFSEEVLTKCGDYVFRYTATDKAGNSAYLERTITLEHNYGECTDNKDGTHSQTCANCGDRKTENCVWDEGKITKEPTCTEKGVKTYTCTVCGGTETEEIDALGHDFSKEWTSDGENHWHKCSRCDAIDGKAAHSGGEATCSAKAECEVCGAEYGEIDAKNHTLKAVEAKDATAETAGNKAYWICEDCGKLFLDAEGKTETTLEAVTLPALGYKVTVSGGTIKDHSGSSGNFAKDASVTVIANSPEEGKEFKGWYIGDELVSEETTYTFKVTGEVTLTAKYEDAQKTEVQNGCGSVVFGSTVFAGIALAAAGLVIAKKKKD